jgi:SAM-dependent methyltransferase
MEKYMKDQWNQRYSCDEFVYGVNPNKFFEEQIQNLKPGKLLLLGEGEGRNSVFAAQNGWDVDAVDWSDIGRKKALKFARTKNVLINYIVKDLALFNPGFDKYDAVGLIYLHLDVELREDVHRKVIEALKPGGRIIIEAYEKDQIGKSSGGPKDEKLLYSLENIVSDFSELEFEYFKKEIVTLDEGDFHKGEAVVIRFVGIKSK